MCSEQELCVIQGEAVASIDGGSDFAGKPPLVEALVRSAVFSLNCKREERMCGRFTQAYSWSEVVEFLRVIAPAARNLRPRYNVSPTTTVEVSPSPDRHY